VKRVTRENAALGAARFIFSHELQGSDVAGRSVCRNSQAVGVVVPQVFPSLMGVVGGETYSQTPLTAGRRVKVYSGFEGGATSEKIVRRSVLWKTTMMC
jgi:hypothetical protein